MKNIYKSKYYKATEMVGFIAFALVILVQRFIRPNSKDFSEPIKHLLGIMPNLLAGIAMSIALFIHGKKYFDRFEVSPIKAMLVSVLLSILGLILWEYIQVFAHRPFDIEDVYTSIIGALLSAIIIYLNISNNKKNNLIE